jgi:hypothetical protein
VSLDLEAALVLEPTNKSVREELGKTVEILTMKKKKVISISLSVFFSNVLVSKWFCEY